MKATSVPFLIVSAVLALNVGCGKSMGGARSTLGGNPRGKVPTPQSQPNERAPEAPLRQRGPLR